MTDPSDASGPETVSPPAPRRRTALRLTALAPEFEPAPANDRSGKRLGLAIAVGGGALFWAAVAGAVLLSRR